MLEKSTIKGLDRVAGASIQAGHQSPAPHILSLLEISTLRDPKYFSCPQQ
jgi:hypothetical protein